MQPSGGVIARGCELRPSRGGMAMAKAESLQEVDSCVHHWVLDPPRGELTFGRCKKCAEERQFTGETSYRIGRGSSRRR